MSNVCIGSRQSGKTTLLIRESARTGATIAVATYPMAQHVKFLAKSLDLDIPEPVTYAEIFRTYRENKTKRYRENKTKRYLVDELQMMLGQLNVDIATLDAEAALFLK